MIERCEPRVAHYERDAAGSSVIGTITATISLSSCPDGSLRLAVRPIGNDTILKANDATLVLSVWQESDDIVRARVQHPASGAFGYFQGNGTLIDLGNALGFALEPPEPA